MNDCDNIARSLKLIQEVIMPFPDAYSDSDIGGVGCIVEGQIATAKGLFAIAHAIERLAEVMESKP